MNQQQTITTIAQDLAHIRDGPDLDVQNELRVLYNLRGSRDLAQGKPRKDTVLYCIDFLKQSYPGWQPNIDKAYFGVQ